MTFTRAWKNHLVGVSGLAMKRGREAPERLRAVTMRKDFTRRQLLVCLMLRVYPKATYRV